MRALGSPRPAIKLRSSTPRLALQCKRHETRNRAQGNNKDDASASVPPQDLRTYKQRRWSTLGPSLEHRPGTVLGAAALVAGTTIGAGILALPAVTKDAGFIPASSTLLGFYVFSILSGLMIAEVNINTVCELGSGAVSLQSMTQRTLGTLGTRTSSAAYVFLHYALLVAYIARAGGSIADVAGTPDWLAAASFTIALGGLCFFASTLVLDIINSVLLLAVVASFVGLLTVALPDVDVQNLSTLAWPAVPDTLPVVALSFVYHNVVPVVVSNLEGDVVKVRKAIVGGLAVPLLMFLGWEAAMLGSVPPGGDVVDPVDVLRSGGAQVAPLIEAFSFLAIATSFIGFVLGLTDFFTDSLSLQRTRWPAYLLTLVPPYAIALAFPEIFFQALDSAGTFGVLVLFGVLPPAMAWSERYWGSTITQIRVCPGGRPVLLGVGVLAAAIIGNELYLALTGAL